MHPPLQIRALRLHRLAIPMRLKFEHAAAARDTADPLVVELTAGAPYAQHVGFGETLARAYVTGETADSVVDDVTTLFAPLLAELRAESFAEALEFIETLPLQASGRVVTAARAAVELALLDLACRVFRRRPADVAGWMDLPGFGPPGCRAAARYSGEVVGRSRKKLTWVLRAQRWYGLRDFKIKVGTAGWEDRLAWAYEVLQGDLERGKATLRADANGAWSLAEALDAAPVLENYGVSALEQPLTDGHEPDLGYLAEQTTCHLIADESLLTPEDGQRLIKLGGARVFNIRLAKNGGLLPALRLARQALAAGLDVQLGCMVGETSILTAAGQAFLEACPGVRFLEGAFGGWLLRGDVTKRSLRFGYGGRLRRLRGPGWGVEVDPARLTAFAAERARTVGF